MSQALLVTGGGGLLGSAVVEHLGARGRDEEVLAPRRAELDLLDGPSTLAWFREHRPAQVIHLAG
ncbi:MAG: NAD-dependent epimerase/dehydratase family protein, partial [Thermoleophilia bacterium]